jgi:hypothetical protein
MSLETFGDLNYLAVVVAAVVYFAIGALWYAIHALNHLFDIDEDLYRERMRLEFIRRQRGEENFRSVDELIAQMDRDAARAREILGR